MLAELFSAEAFFTLAMLIMLQAVLGFDNLLYISIESKRVPEADQSRVRRVGIGLAIILRIVLLVVLVLAIEYFKDPWFSFAWTGLLEGDFSLHALIVLIGGVFIMYTAFKEIMHMLAVDDLDHAGVNGGTRRSVASAMAWIVVMNLVFSFDSILAAISLTDGMSFWPAFVVMSVAILISGLMMIYLADTVSEFLKKNRMFEVLGLFILFIVGIMLLSEGGHLAHLRFFGYAVEPMAKTTFYFALGVLVLVDVVQSKYQKKLMAMKRREMQAPAAAGGEHA